MLFGNSLDTLFVMKPCKTKRLSSYATDGSNDDSVWMEPGETREMFDLKACGICRHIWCTIEATDPNYLVKMVLRIYWDGEEHPSVEAPIGDFFGIGFGIRKNYQSLPLNMSPHDGKAFNCFFPMPFSTGARLTITNECDTRSSFYYYFDYEEYDELPAGEDTGRFHAQWRRQNPTSGWGNKPEVHIGGDPSAVKYLKENIWNTCNTTGDDNYTILEATGRGHYVGCNLNIDCFARQSNDWYGEGDDMIFVDGEPWPPAIHGTGTEDYFGTAFCPQQEFAFLYNGLTIYNADKPKLGRGWPFSGKNSTYRYHINDPVRFEKSIRVTIEHGHNNNLANDYSSTAYWYQAEPHDPSYTLPPVEKRIPRPDGYEMPYESAEEDE